MGSLIQFAKKLPFVLWLYELPYVSRAYHFCLAFLGAFYYGFPSGELVVIGVTGTKGKTTTAHLICHILNSSGRKCGLLTTTHFQIGTKTWDNTRRQTMLGRFALQKLLRQMVDEKCEYAVVETSSEGIVQYRHRFISYNAVVFTNLSPEHIERHGGFENYRTAKVSLFSHLAKTKNSIGIYNIDDENISYFLQPAVARKIGFTIHGASVKADDMETYCFNIKKLSDHDLELSLGDVIFAAPLVGEFNASNVAAAVVTGISMGISQKEIVSALLKATAPPGRMQVLEEHGIRVIVDYAHEPSSLKAIYEAAKLLHPKRLIGVLGSQGGGRDVWKRAEMGRIVSDACDVVILTNEDPWGEDPAVIMDDMEKGIREKKGRAPAMYKIIDRKEALTKAITLAEKGDIVVSTGKGGEVLMNIAPNEDIPWSEATVVSELLKARFSNIKSSV